MRRRTYGFGFAMLAALALLPTAAILPAAAIGVPAAPAKPGATPGNATARVTWVAPANNGSPITGYVVTPFVGTAARAARTFNSTALAQTIASLGNGTSYTFKVAAKNAHGTGPMSVASVVVKVGTPVAPGHAQVAPGNTQIRLNWTAPVNNGSPVLGYVVTPYVAGVARAARTFNTTALAQNITALANGTAYTFKVAARNARGIGPMSAASAAVKPNAGPTLKAVMNATIGQPILVNSAGMTVYAFVPDGTSTSSHVGTLRTTWPYVTWAGTLTVGAGLNASLATGNVQIDNTRLIAYNGHLLYTFVADHVPGDVTGQGLAQFYVLDASGNIII